MTNTSLNEIGIRLKTRKGLQLVESVVGLISNRRGTHSLFDFTPIYIRYLRLFFFCHFVSLEFADC